MLNAHLDWPHVGQVFRLERRRTVRGRTSVEVTHGITSLGPDAAGAADLLRLTRQHWGIENALHHVRDVSFGEDACRVRKGSAPQVLAALRNAALALLNLAGWTNKAAAQRRHAAHYPHALALIRGSPRIE
jgi:hypothetical protein